MSAELEEKIRSSTVDGFLPCPAAFNLAEELGVTRKVVGDTCNQMLVRVSNCQLGCFGTKKATHEELLEKQLSPAAIDRVKETAVDNRVPCPTCFKIAGQLGLAPMEVGDAASLQGIKVKNCQLGCFP